MAFDDFGRGAGYKPLSSTSMVGPTSYGELFKNVNAKRQNAAKYKLFADQFRQRLGQNLSGGAFSTTGGGFSPAMNPGTTAPTQTSPGSNDLFSLLQVSKDPSGRFDNVNRSLLDKVASFKPNYGQIRNTSASAMDKLNLAQGDVDANRADTDNLIAKFNALSPALDKQTSDQTNALNRVYDGGLKGEFAANTEAARNAERRAADLAMRQALFQNRLGSTGGASSSYGKAQLADATGRIAIETAARDADRRRQDTAALLGAQERNLGRVQDLNEKNLLRSNIPIDARSRILDQEVNLALKRLGAAGQAASIEQMTDELSTVGRQLGMTGQALQNYLATNFFGVQKQGQDYPLYISDFGGGPRPQPYFPNQGGGGYGDNGGGFGGPDPNKPPGIPDWVNKLRAGQGWRKDASGNYTQPGSRPPGSYNLPNDFDDYGDPNSPLYYPDYNNYQPGEVDFLQDYYENPERYVDAPYQSGADENFNEYADYVSQYDW
jgi:hypothetical protein